MNSICFVHMVFEQWRVCLMYFIYDKENSWGIRLKQVAEGSLFHYIFSSSFRIKMKRSEKNTNDMKIWRQPWQRHIYQKHMRRIHKNIYVFLFRRFLPRKKVIRRISTDEEKKMGLSLTRKLNFWWKFPAEKSTLKNIFRIGTRLHLKIVAEWILQEKTKLFFFLHGLQILDSSKIKDKNWNENNFVGEEEEEEEKKTTNQMAHCLFWMNKYVLRIQPENTMSNRVHSSCANIRKEFETGSENTVIRFFCYCFQMPTWNNIFVPVQKTFNWIVWV